MSVYESPAIFPITALSKNPKEVKEAAAEDIVQITENGRGAYVFASLEAFNDLIRREREDAAYEAYCMDEIGRGIADLEAGHVSASIEGAFAKAERLRENKRVKRVA